uniref:ATP synthase complex subunit 8 n=1 Tax=Graphocaecilius interpretatus TaxID=2596997 RepID=A0A8K1ZFL1_9NEOP|nr:ATP synthase F0 subunit 8 [Graphocaecilius interpretatus]
MPQMSPIWWLPLFIMFIFILLMTNSLNYFYKNYKISYLSSKTNLNKKFIAWKW